MYKEIERLFYGAVGKREHKTKKESEQKKEEKFLIYLFNSN